MKQWAQKAWNFPLLPVVTYIALFLALGYVAAYVWIAFFHEPPSGKTLVPVLAQVVWQFALSTGLLYFLLCQPQKRTLASVGFRTQYSLQDVVVGFFCGILLVSAMVAMLWLTGVYHFQQFNSGIDLSLPLIIFFFGAFTEEVIFRSFIFLTVEKRWGTTVALIITSVLFGAAHMINNIEGLSALEKAFGCFCLMLEAGLILNAAFLVRRSLWLPVGLHWAWNFFEGPIFGTSVSGSNICSPIITAQMTGPFMSTGGAFGPEASLSGLVIGTLAGLAMLTYARKRGKFSDAQVVD